MRQKEPGGRAAKMGIGGPTHARKQPRPVAEICRKAGISQATCFNWKKRFELLPVSWTGS